MIIAACIFIILMAFAARAHGAATEDAAGNPTGWPKWGRLVATILFGVSFAAVNYALYEVWWLALALGALSAGGLATGHGRFYNMKGANLSDKNPELIEQIIAPIFTKLRLKIDKPLYSWVCMGVKGLMIGAAAGPVGFSLAFLWPLAYSVSFRVKRDSAPAEWTTGGFAAMAQILALLGV